MDKQDYKKIGIGALVGILIALVIVFGIEAFSNKQSEQTVSSSETVATSSSSSDETTSDTTSSSEPATSEVQANDATKDNQQAKKNQNGSSLRDNDSNYIYVGENDQEKWYVNKFSCKVQEEGDDFLLMSFELSRYIKSSNKFIDNTCYLGGYDGNRSFRYGSDGQWESVLRTNNPLYKKVNDTVIQILREQRNK